MTLARFSRIQLGDHLVGTDEGAGVLRVDVDHKAQLTATWAGPVSTVTGGGPELHIPKIDGAVVTFNLLSLFARLTAAPAGTVTFTVEKSTGSGAFSAVSIGSLTHGAGQREEEDDALTGTVTSGDKVRVNFTAVAGASGGAYEVELVAIQQ